MESVRLLCHILISYFIYCEHFTHPIFIDRKDHFIISHGLSFSHLIFNCFTYFYSFTTIRYYSVMSIDYEAVYADITDITVLKQKRRARRSTITRQEQTLSNYSKTPLSDIKQAEVTSKLYKLRDLVNDHEALQNRIDDLIPIGEENTELDKDSQLLLKHSKILDDYECLYNQLQAWCSGCGIRHDSDILLSTSSLNSEVCRDSYDKLKIEYKDFLTSAHSYLSCPDISKLVDSVDVLMKKLLDKASTDFEPKATLSSGSSASTTSANHAIPYHHSRLKLDLPTFSGDVLDWREFWSIFSARLSRETSLSEHEKISCLENAMSDKGAKAIVRVHSISGSYSECVAALRERYDRNKIVYRHHVQKLTQLKPIQDTYESLCQTIHDLTRHTSGMKSCDGATYEQLIVAMIEPLLPTVLIKLWSDFTSDSIAPPTLSDLLKFFKRRSQAVEAVASPKTVTQSQAPTKNIATSRFSQKPKALHVRGQNQEHCPCCDSSHAIYQCSQFKSLTVDKRFNFARRHRLCFNCLSKTHSIEDCYSKITCKECGRKHHSLLHRTPNNHASKSVAINSADTAVPPVASTRTPNSQASNSVATNSADTDVPPDAAPTGSSTSFYQRTSDTFPTSTAFMPATALATVSVPGRQCKARVLMDTGSGITLISNRLAQSLKAKKQRSVHEITGLNGTKCVTSKNEVFCILSSANETGGEEVVIRAHVVDQITSDYALQDLSSIRSLPFLQGKQLADPEFGKSGRIDLLLIPIGVFMTNLSQLLTVHSVRGIQCLDGLLEVKRLTLVFTHPA